MKIIDGNITAPAGFYAAGDNIGIKKDKKDLTLLSSEVLAAAAGCFTQNIVKAAPVVIDSQIIEARKKIKGIVINSGNANACTGEQGLADAHAMTARFAALLGVPPDEVLVCSTGVIGVNLPMDTVLQGIEDTYTQMGHTLSHGENAALGIMTTDTFPKTVAVEITLDGRKVIIGGMAKGSGMIHPNMATLLSFITTDAAISAPLLQRALQESVQESYNMISVDGDTSTNDTILALANGMAENTPIMEENEDYGLFAEALAYVNRKLAIDIARDGEGATKLIEVNVTGASNQSDARALAKSVVSSSLFKAAMFGADANWGRVLCAMGYSGVIFDPKQVSLDFVSRSGLVRTIENGVPQNFDEALAGRVLSERDITVNIMLHDGDAKATAWGCDLTYDYVKINGDYRS